MMRMKILQIITRLISGGAQRVVVDTCAHLVKQGHDVHLAYGPIYGPEGSMLDEAKASGATLHEISSMVRQVAPLTDWRCYRALRKLVRTINPDVVHTHSSKAGIIGRSAAWKERGVDTFDLQGAYFIKRDGRRYINYPDVPAALIIHTVHGLPFHQHQSKLVHHAYVVLERFAARRCHHLIAVSEAMVDAFVDKQIAPREKFTVIPSGVDVDTFSVDRSQGEAVKRELGIPVDRRVVAIVARIDPLKGHADLIEAMAQLPGAHLLCIGDGWNRAAVEAAARKKLGDRATFTGLVASREVARLLTCAEINALPSYQEGQGLTLAEALLAGCAVVGYDTGGIGSVCIDSVTGRLVPTGDKTKLRDAIHWLLDHPEEAAELTRQGQHLVRTHFSNTGMVAKVETLYMSLMKKE